MADNQELLRSLKKEQAERKKQLKGCDLKESGMGGESKANKKKKKGDKQSKMQDVKDDKSKYATPMKLPRGYLIKSKKQTTYHVEASITDSVYIVRNKVNERLFCMKLEWQAMESDIHQLKREVFVLMDASKHQTRFNRHFPKLHTKGRIPNAFNYVMMALCDYNLDDLRTTVLEGCDFSKPNAARLAMQSYQAIHDLHSLGYIHRNISPTKFVFGLNRSHLIYLVGFTLSYHFEQRYDIKVSKSPRRLPKLINRTFLPRNYHRNKDLSRKDDLESWVYLCFNLFGRRILPWNEQFNDLNMFVNKERLFSDEFDECYKYVPLQFKTILHSLDKCGENERPDYTFIGMMLVTMKENIKFNFYGPFDWQKGAENQENKEKEDEGGEDLKLDDEKKSEKKTKKKGQDADEKDGKKKRGAFQNDEEESSKSEKDKDGK